MEHEAGGLAGVSAALGGGHACGRAGPGSGRQQAGPEDDFTRLEHGRRIPEDEVHGAFDPAPVVEVAERVRVERVLVAEEGAVIEGREVAIDHQGHRLVLRGTRRVLECHPHRHEFISAHTCAYAKSVFRV